KTPHEDALVIAPIISNFQVRRVLVDEGSAANILSYEVYTKMNLPRSKLKPVKTPLHGFAGETIIFEGMVSLPLVLCQAAEQITTIVNFLVVKMNSPYNVLLGRPLLNAIKAFSSSYYLTMKFPTENGVGVERGDQEMARQCNMAGTKGKGTEVKIV